MPHRNLGWWGRLKAQRQLTKFNEGYNRMAGALMKQPMRTVDITRIDELIEQLNRAPANPYDNGRRAAADAFRRVIIECWTERVKREMQRNEMVAELA